jgi:hypothetical protein
MSSTAFLLTMMRSQFVLYNLVVIIILAFVHFTNIGDKASVATMIIVALLTTFFSKNMIVVMAVALGATLLLNLLNINFKINEGLENGSEDKAAKPTPEPKVDASGNAISEKTVVDASGTAVDIKKLNADLAAALQSADTSIDGATIEQHIAKMTPLLNKVESFADRLEGLTTRVEGLKGKTHK